MNTNTQRTIPTMTMRQGAVVALSLVTLVTMFQLGVSTVGNAVFPSHLGDNICAIKNHHLGPEFETLSVTHKMVAPFVKAFQESSFAPECREPESIVSILYNELIKPDIDTIKSFFSALVGSKSESEPTITVDDNDDVFGIKTLQSRRIEWLK